MIDRYSRPEMANIWSEENKYRAWLEVEILLTRHGLSWGKSRKEDVALIREKAGLLTSTVFWEIEQETRSRCGGFHACSF